MPDWFGFVGWHPLGTWIRHIEKVEIAEWSGRGIVDAGREEGLGAEANRPVCHSSSGRHTFQIVRIGGGA